MAFQSSDANIADAVKRFADDDGVSREVPIMQVAYQDSAGPVPKLVSGAQGLPVTLTGLDAISGYIDGIETALTTITGHVDGLEASLTTIAGHVDGVETLLTSLGGYVDGLEGLLDGVETSLSSIDGKLAAGNGAAAGAIRVTVANDSTGVIATVTTVTTVSALTEGGVAHDAADSGKPHKIGSRAVATLSTATLVAAADRSDAVCDLDGAIILRLDAPLGDNTSGVAAITDGSSTSVIAAQGSGVKTYITDVTIANTSATAVTVDLRDGAAGSVKWTFPVPANTAGVAFSFRRPLAFSADTAVCADPSAAASTVTVSLNGFKSKV